MPEKEEPQSEQTNEKCEMKEQEENKDSNVENEAKKETPEEPLQEMRAVVLTGFGGLKSVKLQKKPEPTVNEGEILVKVKACGLGFQDLMTRQGAIDAPPKTPFIMGSECAGEVVSVGQGVEDFTPGQLVVCLPEFRAWAELVVVPAKLAFALPSSMTCEDAAAFSLNAVAAHMLLFDVAGLAEGHTLVLHSAGGGLGLMIAQLARTVKDVTLIGVASKDKHPAIKDYYDHLLERGCDYVSEVRKLYPDGVDIVLDCLCGEECNRGYSLLKPMGKYVLYGTSNVVTGETKSFFSVARSWWQVDKVSPIKLYDENKTLCGFNLRHLIKQQQGLERVHKAMQTVLQLWKQGVVKPVVDSVWAFEDVPEAMQIMHDRKNVGKIILDPAKEPRPKPSTPAKEKGRGGSKDDGKKKGKGADEKKEEKGAGDAPEKKDSVEETTDDEKKDDQSAKDTKESS